MGRGKTKPEWAPENSGAEFAVTIMAPASVTESSHNFAEQSKIIPISQGELSSKELYDGVLGGNRTILAKAITLIESNTSRHKERARELLSSLLPYSGKSIRICITGAPGSGKSTFIETFGNYLCEMGHKVAVLAIDPSSNRSKGSILGDKTRMESLSRNLNAFIRPSPSSGNLGGVAAKTRETAILCEAAGFDVILIETIGVGQSEIVARTMVDFFLLVLIPGEGDELQGIKKGSVELSDLLIINKADGHNIQSAELTKHQYEQALHYTLPATAGWNTPVLLTSSFDQTGFVEVWETISDFIKNTNESGAFLDRRNEQSLDWFKSNLNELMKDHFYSNASIKHNLKTYENAVLSGKMTSSAASAELFERYLKSF